MASSGPRATLKATFLRGRARRHSGEGVDHRPKTQGLFTPGGLQYLAGSDYSARTAEEDPDPEVDEVSGVHGRMRIARVW